MNPNDRTMNDLLRSGRGPSNTTNPAPPLLSGLGTPAAPKPSTGFSIHPPGVPASLDSYNYEPQPDRSWKMYPPGVKAPDTAFQASLPRAASTSQLARMSQELGGFMRSYDPNAAEIDTAPAPAPALAPAPAPAPAIAPAPTASPTQTQAAGTRRRYLWDQD